MKLFMFSSIQHRPCTFSSISSLQRILKTTIPVAAAAAAVSTMYLSSSSSPLFVQSFQPSACFLQSHQKYRLLQPMTTTATIATPSTTTTTTALSLSTTTIPSVVLPQLKKQYLLQYTYVNDVLEKRGPYREEHLAIATELVQAGTCISGGPTANITINDTYCSISQIPTGALFIFTSIDAAQMFISRDPYVSNGIVTNYSINEWTIVVS